jgi:hypothetical protein
LELSTSEFEGVRCVTVCDSLRFERKSVLRHLKKNSDVCKMRSGNFGIRSFVTRNTTDS